MSTIHQYDISHVYLTGEFRDIEVTEEPLTELEKRFQASAKEADQSFKQRENIHEPTVEQKAHALDIYGRLKELHDELTDKANQARQMELLPENLSPTIIEYFNGVATLLDECATAADRLRIKIEHERASEDFSITVQRARSEDLATMINYLDKVSQQVKNLVDSYEAEMEKQAAQREREGKMLDLLNKVLIKYL